MHNNIIKNKLGLILIAFVLGPILAWWAGGLIVDENYITLGIIALIPIVISVINYTRKYLLEACLVVATLDLWMAPIGFKTSSFEQILLMISLAWCISFWHKKSNLNASYVHQELFSFTLFKGMTILACFYAVIHFLFNMQYPYEPLAFGFNGAIKTYLQFFGPFVLILFAFWTNMIHPQTARDSSRLLKLFLLSIVVVFLTKLLMIIRFGDILSSGGMTSNEKMQAIRSFYIPVLNIWDSTYTLRTLGPAAVLIGSIFYFNKPYRVKKNIPFLIIIIGFTGSAISGGRAVIVISTILFIIVLLRVGNIKALILLLFSFLIALLSLMALPLSLLEKSPYHLQRSLGFLRPDLMTEATLGIKGSSNMRIDYFTYAWTYYSSGDMRLLLTGRSVGEMDSQDEKSILNYDENARLFFAIRRLATHNGLTDALLGWGLVGYIMSLGMWISCAAMLHCLNKKFIKGSHGDCWSFAAIVFYIYWIIYSHIGGSNVWMLCVCFILIALAQTDGLKSKKCKIIV